MNALRRFSAAVAVVFTLGVVSAGTVGATPDCPTPLPKTTFACIDRQQSYEPPHRDYHPPTFWESHLLGTVVGVGCLVIWGVWKLSVGGKKSEPEPEPEPVHDYPATPPEPVHDYPATPTPPPTPPVPSVPSPPTPPVPSTDEDW